MAQKWPKHHLWDFIKKLTEKKSDWCLFLLEELNDSWRYQFSYRRKLQLKQKGRLMNHLGQKIDQNTNLETSQKIYQNDSKMFIC